MQRKAPGTGGLGEGVGDDVEGVDRGVDAKVDCRPWLGTDEE